MFEMNADELCAPTASVETKRKVLDVLGIVAGESARDAKEILEAALRGVDQIARMPTISYQEQPLRS